MSKVHASPLLEPSPSAVRGRPLTRKGLADKVGCGVETVRFYEGAGLMPEPDRGPNGYRLYGAEDVRRLGFICAHAISG